MKVLPSTWIWVGGVLFLGCLPGQGWGQTTTGSHQSSPPRRSWTSDRHALRPGDLVTVVVDESWLASARKNETAAQERKRDLGLGANLPGGTSTGGEARSRNDVSERERGEALRQQRFSGEITARVTEVTPEGLARIEGSKRLKVGDAEEEVTLRGWIRPQDVAFQNTVESWRVADAELLYVSRGKLGKSKSLWTRLINWIWF